MTLSRLQHLVESSALPEEDKDLWLHAMEAMDDDAATLVLEALSGDEHLDHVLDEMTRSIKLKRLAMADGDSDLMGQLVQEEVERIQGV
jgi:hypothetical protein